MAELWSVYEGIKFAKARGCTRLEVESDSDIVVKQIQTSGIGGFEGWKLLKKIKSMIHDTGWEVRVVHIYREANKCADALAALACDQRVPMLLFPSVPNGIANIVANDLSGVSTPRVFCLLGKC